MKRKFLLGLVLLSALAGCKSSGDHPAPGYHESSTEAEVYGVLHIDGNRQIEIVARCPVSGGYPTLTVGNNKPLVVKNQFEAAEILGVMEQRSGIPLSPARALLAKKRDMPAVNVDPKYIDDNKQVIGDVSRCFYFSEFFR